MKIKKTILFIILFHSIGSIAFCNNKIGSLLKTLDQTIDSVPYFDIQKEKKILNLKYQLENSYLKENIHETHNQLYREYEAFVFDSALFYVKKHYDFAVKDKNTYWINDCKLKLARMYATFASFGESIDLLNSINKADLAETQLIAFYNCFAEVYNYWGEYASNEDVSKYISLRDTYQDSALMVTPKGSYDYDINFGRRCIELRDLKQAEEILLPHLSTIEPRTRTYAMLTAIVAYMYDSQGNKDLHKKYLAISAMADLQASVKENTSLSFLSFCLLNEGDVIRSNRYIKKSMEDANFYNARLRDMQVSRILPLIDSAYQLEKEKYQSNLQNAVFVIGILSLFLIGLVIYLVFQMKKLSRTRMEVIAANKELQRINSRLVENNQIKEEYIGRFLNQCSVYIDKLENYRKSLNKKAASGKISDLFDMIKSSQIIDDELKEFYQNFDTTFLNLFPDFIEEFNKLLPIEDQIVPKTENSLSVELRVFALMRLGITDSTKIASFLRYSITTIYNYRSKYRNKSLVPRESFEEFVMKISSKN